MYALLKRFDLLCRAVNDLFAQRSIRHKKQSPEGSRLRGFYFRLHPLMIGELAGENTSDVSSIHYCDRGIDFDGQDAVEGGQKSTFRAPVIVR